MNASGNIDKEWSKQVIEDLKKLGLSDKEAIVYISLLQLGEVGSSKIITFSGLHGQFVYQALENLEKQGLVQHATIRGRKKFTAKGPSVISLLIDQKKKLADDLTKRLENIVVLPDQQQFEIFQGDESFIAHEFDVLNKAQKGSTLLVIGGTGDNFVAKMGKQLGEYEYIRTKKEISVRYIGSEGQRIDLTKAEMSRPLFQYRLLPGLFTGEVNTNIWPDSVGFNIFSEPVTNFTVANKQISDGYKLFFETLWKLAR